MNCDEFLATLDADNPFYQRLCELLQDSLCRDLIAFPKGRDLVERVQELQHKRCPPVVDQTLKLVIGVPEGGHSILRNLLYTYHESAGDREVDLPRHDRGGTWYLLDGLGYYVSSMRPNVVVAGQGYRPDRFDKDLFLMYQVDTAL